MNSNSASKQTPRRHDRFTSYHKLKICLPYKDKFDEDPILFLIIAFGLQSTTHSQVNLNERRETNGTYLPVSIN